MLRKKFMSMTLYEALWYFMIYAFIGWAIEELVVFLIFGELVKRGFLYGPYGPIYGFGMLIIILFLTPIRKRIVPLYFGGVVLITVFEYLSGYMLEILFHQRWWDYSDFPFSLNGYISLLSSLSFGFACVFIIRVAQPRIKAFVEGINYKRGRRILIAFYLIFTLDNVATLTNMILKRIK